MDAAGAGGQGPNNDVFGLYGELLNVRDYDCDSGELGNGNGGGRSRNPNGPRAAGEDLRRSDPELDTIPYRVSTLDRRVRMKTSRPRSLDMSSWSVESRGSAQTTSSSEAGSERPSPNVSRNASFQSQQSGGSGCTVSSLNPSINGPVVSTSSPSHHSSVQQTTSLPTPIASPEESSSSSQSTGAVPKASSVASGPSPAARKKQDAPRTVTTLMGGRGYINWRRASVEKNRTSSLAQINNSDAYLVIWEMKL